MYNKTNSDKVVERMLKLFGGRAVEVNHHKYKDHIGDPGSYQGRQIALGRKYGREPVGDDEERRDHKPYGQVYPTATPYFAAGHNSADQREQQYSDTGSIAPVAFHFQFIQAF